MLVPWDQGRNHAVREVAVQVGFARPPSPSSLDQIAKDVYPAQLRERLPKLERLAAPIFSAEFLVNQQPGAVLQMPAGTQGVEMTSFQRDGQVSWRVRIHSSGLVINCLEYEGWEQFLPSALHFAMALLTALDDDAPLVTSVTLQYINSFSTRVGTDWRGCWGDFEDTFRQENPEMPPGLWSRRSPEMHLNMGYFIDGPQEGRRSLNRHHMLSRTEDGNLVFLLDLLHRTDFVSGYLLTRSQLVEEIERILKYLRVEIRTALRMYLTDAMLENIGAIALEHER